MNGKTLRVGAGLAVVIVVFGLTGCVAGEMPFGPAVSTAAVATSSASQFVADQKITEDQANELPEGYKAYQMLDESWVVVDTKAPLTETVKADIQAVTNSHPGGTTQETIAKVRDQIADDAYKVYTETGKHLVVIKQTVTLTADEEVPTLRWIGAYRDSGGSAKFFMRYSKDNTSAQVQAGAEAFIAGQPDPDQWVIVVAQ